MSRCVSGVRLCDKCSTAIGLAKRAHKARVAMKAKPRVEAAKAKREARNEVMGQHRITLMAMAGYACERCSAGTFADVGHAHHLYGGSGRRRAEESLDTLAWLCPACHRAVHAHPIENKALRLRIADKRRATT